METYDIFLFSLSVFLASSERSQTQWKLNLCENSPIYGKRYFITKQAKCQEAHKTSSFNTDKII